MPKKRNKRIVKEVVREYLTNGLNMSKALRPYNKHLDNDSLSVKASRWKTADEIKKEVDRLLGNFKIDDIEAKHILGKLYMVGLDNDRHFKSSDRMRALELLGKYKHLFDDSKTQINIHNIGEDRLNTIISKRNVSKINSS